MMFEKDGQVSPKVTLAYRLAKNLYMESYL